MGAPPKPVFTRWASWLEAAIYYCKHFPAVKRAVNSFKGDGILVRNAKEAVNQVNLVEHLLAIERV